MARNVVLAVLVALAVDRSAFAKAPVRAPGAAAAAAAVAAPVPANAKTVRRLAPPLGCDRLTIAEGLPNSQVHAIVQDQRGFMWFGTQDGLARYDGAKMQTYRPI